VEEDQIQDLKKLEHQDTHEYAVIALHLHKAFQSNNLCRKKRPHVIDDVSFSLEKGESLAILGGSKSGKSTLLQIITNEVDPSSGSVSVFGLDGKT